MEDKIAEWCYGNTADFDSAILSSSLSPASTVVFSLFGKVPSCDGGEQGSISGDNRMYRTVRISPGQQ